MKIKKVKGLLGVVVLMVLCIWLLADPSKDYYSMHLTEPNFRVVNLADYSGDSTHLLEYVPESDTTIKSLTRGPINLERGEYRMEISYAAADDSTVLKVFAADYVGEENNIGKILVNQPLSPEETIVRFNFTLDQKVDSIFFTFETTDDSFALGRWDISSTHPVWNDRYLYMSMVLLMGAVLLYLLNSQKTKVKGCTIATQSYTNPQTRLLFFMVGALAVFMASIPLLNPSFIDGHDTIFHIARIEGMCRGLQSGQFPVRVHGGTMNDYGYANSMFYPELLMYPSALLRMMGVSLVTCFRVYVLLLNIITLVAAYAAFKRFTNSRFWGLCIGVLYLLVPYRMVCVYFRSAIGEVGAMAFLPLVFYGLYAILYGKKQDWWLLVVGATGVFQCHIITTELTAIFSAVLVLASVRHLFNSQKRWKELLYATICTVLVNLWFLAPMLLMSWQLGPEVFSRSQMVYHHYALKGVFSIATLDMDNHHPVGWIALFTIPAYLMHRIFNSKNEQHKTLYRFGDLLLIFNMFCMLAPTIYMPWESILKIPVLGTMLGSIQFGYRILSIAQTGFCFLLAITIMLWMPKQTTARTLGIGLVCLAVVFVGLFYEVGLDLTAVPTYTKSEHQSCQDNRLAVGQAEYIVQGSHPDEMIANPPALESTNDTFAVSQLKRYGTKTSFRYEMDLAADGENWIVVPVTFIPNYVVKVDGQSVPTVKYEGAKVAFQAPQPQGEVSVVYQEPMTFRVFELLSLASVIGLIYTKKKGIFPFKEEKRK